MEVIVLSAQGLKSTSSGPFSRRLRSFATVTTYPLVPCNRDDKCTSQTRVDDEGGVNPTWGDKFHVPIDTSFLANRYSSIYIQLYTKRLITGRIQLGWCQIPVTDIRLGPEGSIKYLSYRLRARDGTRCEGIVNVGIRLLTALEPVERHRLSMDSDQKASDACQTVIGIPVTTFSLI
ncbi:hypothetical protein K2173_021721 [Erythroxylum novogranatense]|uniref:C2 domain-containing protein n=1 Tax=Erythroxylum novogranatense TaxID=1862640 RepID=A0AAV8TJB2_9ROSI|nr:hypothetical protein K2173_021721 [Erythroxylum novogranatense]